MIILQKNKKIYFASDNHLGNPSFQETISREKKFVSWLDEIKSDAQAIFLLEIYLTFGLSISLLYLKDLLGHLES